MHRAMATTERRNKLARRATASSACSSMRRRPRPRRGRRRRLPSAMSMRKSPCISLASFPSNPKNKNAERGEKLEGCRSLFKERLLFYIFVSRAIEC
ncbi:RING-type domain-containing protein [Psidium guajava]|nr:RING-type domain-containing protein [Psidium guajava]